MRLSMPVQPSVRLTHRFVAAGVTLGVWILSASSPGSAQERLAADLAVISANIITVDERIPRAEALAVRGGKFVAVGSTAEVRSLIGPNTRIVDADGSTVVPGFIDAHMHPEPTYPVTSRLGKVDLSPGNVQTVQDVVAALREKAAITPEGVWVIGARYQDTKLGRHPSRRDLDQASSVHPIFITHSSGHVSAVNSLALETAGIDSSTPDPPGGGFERDDTGRLTGVVWENAIQPILELGPPLPEATSDERTRGLLRTFEAFLSKGITSVVDAGSGPAAFKAYQDAAEQGQAVRVSIMFELRHLPELRALGLRTGFGDDHLRIGAIKSFHGNSLSGRTCWLYEPYEIANPATGERDYYGIPPGRSQAELDAMILEIHEAGFQVAVHSNGDREIDMVLDALERALEHRPRQNHRHRIEHASIVNAGILRRVKELDVVLALHSYVYEHGDKMEAYGAARWNMMHANRSALELGIPVAGNSDYGVSAADPMLRIQSMVTRASAQGKVYGAAQKISVEDALRVWTIGGAYSTFDEKIKGSIGIGKLADFVVLSDDPTSVPPAAIKEIVVDMTFIDGKLQYKR